MEEKRNPDLERSNRINLERTLFDNYLNQIRVQYELAIIRDDDVSSDIALQLEMFASRLGKGARQRRNLIPSTSNLPLHGRIKEKYLLEESCLNAEISEFTEEKKAELKKVAYNHKMLERILENARLVKSLTDHELRVWNRQYDAPVGQNNTNVASHWLRIFKIGDDWMDKPQAWKHRGTHLFLTHGFDFPHSDPLVKRIMDIGIEISRLQDVNKQKGEGYYFGIPSPSVEFDKSPNAKEHREIHEGLRELNQNFNTNIVADLFEGIFYRTLTKEDYKAFRYLQHPKIKPVIARLDNYRKRLEELPFPDTAEEKSDPLESQDGKIMLAHILSHCPEYISGASRLKKRKIADLMTELFPESYIRPAHVSEWLTSKSSQEEYIALRKKYLLHESEVSD